MKSLILAQLLLIKKLQNILHDDIPYIDSNLITSAIDLLSLDNQPTDVPTSVCWMADFLSTLYFAEDAIDTFTARIKLEKDVPVSRTWRWRATCTSKSKGIHHLVFLDQMKTFTAQLRIKERESSVHITEIPAESIYKKSVQQCWEAISSSCLQEDAADFLDPEQRKRLDGFLYHDYGNRVITLVGGAGFAKTTLAKLVYNSPDVIRRFRQHRYWICASETYKSRDVMAQILKQANANVEEPILESGILQMLAIQLDAMSHSRFFVVIDDVRSHAVLENIQARLSKLFEMVNGWIKVIITSRVSTVNSYRIELSPLNEEDSWALFSKKNPDADSSMKNQIFKLSNGIPLAIGLIGSLHSIEKTDLQQGCASSENVVASVSSLCYQHLSSSFKPCFLYMGLFPRGFEIPVRRLYRLWEAEGFLHEDGAETCFQELVSRNLIEIPAWRSDGSPKTCRLPNALHEIFSQKAKDIGFFHILPSSSSSNTPKIAVRRLVAYHGIKKYSPLHNYEEHLRTYISFNTRRRGTPMTKELDMFLKRNRKGRYFTLLKVLDLENVYKPVLPEAMGEVFPFLTYLGLRSTALTWLSDSVGELSWLKMLDVKHTFITSLPLSVFKLDNIIHLYLNWGNLHVPSGSELSFPSKLRTVWGLSLSRDNYVAVMKWLEKSTGIRKLGLQYLNLSTETQCEIIDWILRQTNLESLKLRSTNVSGTEPSTLVLKQLADHLQKLTNLYLGGRFEADVISNEMFVISNEMFPSSLKILTLSTSNLKEDPMPELGKLPHLNTLRLFGDFYSGDKITCKSGGFPELRVLKLWIPERVHEWIIEEGALPCVRQIVIRNMRDYLFQGLTIGITRLERLEELRVESYRSLPTKLDDIVHEIEKTNKNFRCLIDYDKRIPRKRQRELQGQSELLDKLNEAEF